MHTYIHTYMTRHLDTTRCISSTCIMMYVSCDDYNTIITPVTYLQHLPPPNIPYTKTYAILLTYYRYFTGIRGIPLLPSLASHVSHARLRWSHYSLQVSGCI